MSAVYGSWIVPTVTGPSSGTERSCVWVGIDGNVDSTVEQVGTDQYVVDGHAVYRAWWEMMSSGIGQPEQVIANMIVKPGDSITASVQYIASGAYAGEFYLSIVDNSRLNDSFSIYASSSQYQSPLATAECAEWIVEAPLLAARSRRPGGVRPGHLHQCVGGDQRGRRPDRHGRVAVAATEPGAEWRH